MNYNTLAFQIKARMKTTIGAMLAMAVITVSCIEKEKEVSKKPTFKGDKIYMDSLAGQYAIMNDNYPGEEEEFYNLNKDNSVDYFYTEDGVPDIANGLSGKWIAKPDTIKVYVKGNSGDMNFMYTSQEGKWIDESNSKLYLEKAK